VLHGLLTNPAGYSHQGRFYTVDDARTLPGAQVPIAVAATGPKSLAVAARYGDAWITYGEPDSSDLSAAQVERAVRVQSERLAEACAAIGRDPAELRRIYLIGNTAERPLRSVDAFTDFAGRYAALGVTDLVFHDPRPDDPVWSDDPSVVAEIALSGLSGRKDP
jgi:alkanesulfonate monooxygenase SsuD/methylene tetrahydromethanopterin reductase-like flavin-dependent oxidoreductase (luciferase family)